MALTPAQLTSLRAAVFADAPSAALLAAGDAHGLRAALNAASSPAFILWRTKVGQDEIMQNGFDWVRVDNLSVGKARIWEWLFDNQDRTISPTKLNVRAGIDECWKGTAADLAVRAAVYAHCKRTASLAERMLATGTGSDAVPATATYEGSLSELDSAVLIFRDDGTIWTAQG